MAAGQGPTGWGGGVVPPQLSAQQAAADQFQSSVNKYAEVLWNETQLLEAATNSVGTVATFTPTMVSLAGNRVIDPLNIANAPKPRTTIGIVALVGGIVGSGAAGVSGNFLPDGWALAVFPVAVFILIVSSIYTYLRGV